MPNLQAFLATEGYHQIDGQVGEAVLVVDVQDTPTVIRLTASGAEASVEDLLALAGTILGVDPGVRQPPRALTRTLPKAGLDLRGLYFDFSGRHIADKSG